jgi:hypothetical protein
MLRLPAAPVKPDREPMPNSHCLSGLVAKRAELAGRIEHARSELDAMLASLAALDATLRLFDPEIRVQAIRPKPFPPVRSYQSPGMRVRDVLGALRETGQPMTTREIAARLRAGQGHGDGDAKALSRAGEIVGAALRKLRAKGVASAQPGPGTRMLWSLAGG